MPTPKAKGATAGRPGESGPFDAIERNLNPTQAAALTRQGSSKDGRQRAAYSSAPVIVKSGPSGPPCKGRDDFGLPAPAALAPSVSARNNNNNHRNYNRNSAYGITRLFR